MTSPGIKVMFVEMKLTSRKQLKMSWAQLPVLEKLEGQIVRINLGFDVRPERGERVERLGAAPLAFRTLNRAVADVLRRRVTEDVARRRRRRDIAHAPADHDRQLRFVIHAMMRIRNFDLRAVR